MAESKPKLAVYWAASCGGCEIAVTNLHEKLLDLVEIFDFMFCPCLLDTKKKDIEALPDGAIAVTLCNGAIRSSENEEWAKLMRKKSKILVACGACAVSGGIPGLANLHSRQSTLEAIFIDNPSVDNPQKIMPQTSCRVDGADLELPEFYSKVFPLSEVVEVDYFIPGCPPEPEQLWNALVALQTDAPPKRGSMVGCGTSSVCDECKRARTDKKIQSFRRVYEFTPDREECLLEQGVLCMGVATRSGCGGLCPDVNMPCIGCYGPCEGVIDQASKMVSALGSIIDIAPIKGLRNEEAIAEKIDGVLDALPDIAGVAGRFQMASVLARRSRSGG